MAGASYTWESDMTSVPRPDADDSAWQAAWETEDNYWFEHFSSRAYGLGPDYYDRFRHAFRYGFDSARHGLGRTWEEAEADLRTGWDRYEHRGDQPSAWDEIKAAVRDAWDRVVGRTPAEGEARRPEPRE